MKVIKVEKKTVQTGWLKKRFGDCVSQLSVDTKLKLKSAIKDTHRALHGTVYPEIEKICKQFPTSPQGVDEHDVVFGYHDEGTWIPGLAETNPTLKQYIKDYPEEWNIVQKSLGLARQASRHPCAYIISPTPVDSFVPIVTVGGVRVTQFTANAIESAGGLKMDFLVVNSIKDIEECIKIIRKTNPGLPSTSKLPSIMLVSDPVTGEKLNIYDLPEDPEVYKDICEGKVETVFQLDASAARTGLQSFRPVEGKTPIKDITGLAAFVALDRPGPLDAYVEENGVKHNMLVEYARRAAGEPGIGRVAILDQLLPETYGVLVFQEQLTKVFRLLGNTTGAEADNFRVHTSKKQLAKVLADRSVFMNGAIPKLGQQIAERLWEMMVTFANYGFCKSHAVGYSHITYACAWLKHHYPLEWWTAILRNADKNEIDTKFWQYCHHLVSPPDIRYSGSNFDIVDGKIRAPISMLHGIGEKAHNQIQLGAPYSSVTDFLNKIEEHRNRNATTVIKTAEKNGQLVKTVSKKKALSAVNSKVATTLIISGAMDGLFPSAEDLSLYDKLKLYETSAQAILGTKKTKKSIADEYLKIDELDQFQLQKKINGTYVKDIRPICAKKFPSQITSRLKNYAGTMSVVYEYQEQRHGRTNPVVILGGDGLEMLQTKGHLMPIQGYEACFLAFVIEERTFTFKKEGEVKTSIDRIYDIDGVRLQLVDWDCNIKSAEGSIVLLKVLQKPDKPIKLLSAKILQPAFNGVIPEESKEESSE